MTKTIFRNTFLVGMLVLIICALLFFGLQYTRTLDETFNALDQETSYAAAGLETGGIDFLKKLDETNHITWIAADGEVIYDSMYDSPVSNQSEYDEIKEAFESGSGQETRKSDSNGKATMYYAKLCLDGTVIRLARPVSAVRYALLTVSPILWVLILVLIISGILAFRVAKQIVTPINEMDIDDPKNNPYPELAPLLDKIEEQKLTIQEEASSREEMRREFSANVSHELKTPLTSISGFAELMSQGNVSPDKVSEFSKDIYKESQRLIALIDDIIKLSRLDEGNDIPKDENVDLLDICNDVASALRPIASKRNIRIDINGSTTQIKGANQLLFEMIYNLCDNAVKYNFPGGMVTLKLEEDDAHIRLSVSDTGIGIPPEHQKRVFERFYRVDKSHSKEIGGTGLGLSIVKHGALYHGAEIEMESEQGKGTRITLVFPKQAS